MLSSCGFRSTRAASRSFRLVNGFQSRGYAMAAHDILNPKLTAIDKSKLTITKTTTPKELIPNDELVFGKHFTDHMLSLEWTATDGWQAPRITPYQNLSLDPATCVFHYAFECFEGMKAYKDQKGNVRLFRPDKNMARLNRSSARIALPNVDPKAMIDLISQFVKTDERFIPA
jgi:branched-chain amino acid aminotransferase